MKAVFFDIDGTLLSHRQKGGRVPGSTREAMRILREKGILIFVASGRHKKEMEELPLDGLTFDGYVLLGGQLCMDAHGAIFYESPIPEAAMKNAAEIFRKKEQALAFAEKERTYVNFISDRLLEVNQTIHTSPPVIGEYEGGDVYQLVFWGNEEEIAALMERLPDCRMTRWHSRGIDICAADGGKEQGIIRLLEKYGLKREEIVAFGDGENDIEMLQYAGIGIAMGNATRAAKAAADYVTADIDNDGIWKALEKFGLI